MRRRTAERFLLLAAIAQIFNLRLSNDSLPGPTLATFEMLSSFKAFTTMSSNVCSIAPGKDSLGERNLNSFRMIHEIQHVMVKAHLNPHVKDWNVSILCIFNFESQRVERTAIEMYGEYCSGILVVSKENYQFNNSRGTIPVVHRLPDGTSSLDMFREALRLEQYTWFYCARPDRYFLGPHARLRIALEKTNSKSTLNMSEPAMPRSFYVNDTASDSIRIRRVPTSLREDNCTDSTLWNRAALNSVAAYWGHHAPDPSWSCPDLLLKQLEDKSSPRPASFFGFTPQNIEKWQQYTELRMPTSVSGNENHLSHALVRTKALLDRSCEPVWARKFAAVAFDENGKRGYIHDATFLRRNPPEFQDMPSGFSEAVCQAPRGRGAEGQDGIRGLQKIRISPRNNGRKVLCMVYTHSGRHDMLRSISETWGPLCDGFFAGSNATDPSIGAVNLFHEGPEEYGNMWLKVKSMWMYAYENYLDDYDYFHIGGDDHYVIPTNLVHMASTGNWKGRWNQSEPMFLGGSLVAKLLRQRYCGGGSGYTLNRVALNKFATELIDHPDCLSHWKSSEEDVIMSKCFRTIDLQCMDTSDEQKESRYHPFDVNYHTGWTKKKTANWGPHYLEKLHGISQGEGLAQISKNSVSFHLKPLEEKYLAALPPDLGMRRYHAILYGLCENNP